MESTASVKDIFEKEKGKRFKYEKRFRYHKKTGKSTFTTGRGSD